MANTHVRSRRGTSRRDGVGEPVWEIAHLFPRQGAWTEAEYLALEDKAGNRLIELVEGRLEFPPMPNMEHQDIVKFLLMLLDTFVTKYELGRVYFSPLPVHLFPGTYREPDIVFLAEHRIKDRTQPPEGADLVMEVVSPGKEARERDYREKRRDYARAKIPEYWIVDPRDKTITVLVLGGKTYKVHGVFKGQDRATSKRLAGFEVAVRDVFAAGAREA